MIFIHDTRDKPGKHGNVERYLAAQGHEIVRSKLYVGDLALLHDQSVCIDLKQGLSEVESNLTAQHERFRRECERARESGIKLILLVEEGWCESLADVARWKNPRRARWNRINQAHSYGRFLSVKIAPRPPVDGQTLQKMMQTMEVRYGVRWEFCEKADTGAKACALLGVPTGPSAPEASANPSPRGRFVSR